MVELVALVVLALVPEPLPSTVFAVVAVVDPSLSDALPDPASLPSLLSDAPPSSSGPQPAEPTSATQTEIDTNLRKFMRHPYHGSREAAMRRWAGVASRVQA